MWIRCLRGERLLTASYGLRPNLNKRSFSPNEEGSRLFVACFLHTSRRYTFDLDKESTHGQPASCRARPVNVDGDLQNSMWIHGLGDERMPVMSYAFCPNQKKNVYFLPSEKDRDFLSSVFCTPAARRFFLDTWQAPTTHHQPSCELCDPRVGRSP